MKAALARAGRASPGTVLHPEKRPADARTTRKGGVADAFDYVSMAPFSEPRTASMTGVHRGTVSPRCERPGG